MIHLIRGIYHNHFLHRYNSYEGGKVMYQLREANEQDYDFIYNLNNTVYKDYIINGKSNLEWDDDFQRHFSDDMFKIEKIQIILDGEKRIGILELKEKENQMYIEEIQIDPNSQGKGLATEVINDIISRAFKLNYSVGLVVLRINKARELYERLGFSVIDETETHFIMEARKKLLV